MDKAVQRDTGGTGLGLAITKSVVSLHNGEIKLYSKVGEGTTFTLRIPLKYKGRRKRMKKIMHDLLLLSGFDDFSGRMPVKKRNQ